MRFDCQSRIEKFAVPQHLNFHARNLSHVFLLFAAYLRGQMEKCFHRSCDQPSVLLEPEKSFEFLTEITQAVINSVFELTSKTSLDECKIKRDGDIHEEKINLEQGQVLDNFNTIQTEEDTVKKIESGSGMENKEKEVFELNPDLLPRIKNFKPNLGGTQINIENFNVHNNFPDKQDRREDLLVLMEKHAKIDNILEHYFEHNKKPKNSPMVIKFVNSDEL